MYSLALCTRLMNSVWGYFSPNIIGMGALSENQFSLNVNMYTHDFFLFVKMTPYTIMTIIPSLLLYFNFCLSDGLINSYFDTTICSKS